MKKVDIHSYFTTHEIEYFKSIGEYENILNCINFINIMNEFPDNLDEFMDKFNDLPSDPKKQEAALLKLKKQDPKFLKQLSLLGDIFEECKTESKVQKMTKKDLQYEEINRLAELSRRELKLF